MRLKLLTLIFGGLLAVGSAFGANPCEAAPSDAKTERADGPEVPFPLSLEIPFPWAMIEGVWEAQGPGVNALFSFEVREDYADRKILKVVHLDPATGKVMAEGVGIAVDDKKIVRAGMQGRAGTYMLFIRVFKNPDTEKGPKTATVLTLRSFRNPEGSDIHMVVTKVSNTPRNSSTVPTTSSF